MINICISSKNRPMQLDLLLKSLKKHFKEIDLANKTIIYVATNDNFETGYNVLKEEYQDFRFIRQRTFKSDILDCVENKNQYTMFLVDDIVFKDNFSVNDPIFLLLRNNNQMINLSLRLYSGINYEYATNKSINNPQFVKDVKNHYKVWKWPGTEGSYGYGFSLDGDIFNTSFIKPLLKELEYSNPNQLESILNHPNTLYGKLWPIYKCCYDTSAKLINNPANRVQDEFKNRTESNISPEELNVLFLSGKRISLEDINKINNGAVHYPFEYKII